MKKTLAAVVLMLASGCGEAEERGEAVALEELPPGSLDMARQKLPGVKFDSARKIKYQGVDAIEIRGKDRSGKIRKVEVSPDGHLLEIE